MYHIVRKDKVKSVNIVDVYRQLKKEFGPQGWWPSHERTPFCDPYFEIAVGAILTQNTAWNNVASAIANLYDAKALTPKRLLAIHPRTLQTLVRPTGYFRQKTKKLRIFSHWLMKNYHGDITELNQSSMLDTRCSLLAQWGIGPETADSILLYALGQPIFVIDEYTRRLCKTHGVIFKTYDEYRQFFEEGLKKFQNKTELFREYHALIVAWGKKKIR